MKSSQPKVSIILTLHNTRFLFITETINSLLAQTMQDYEILIIDDASDSSHQYDSLYKISPKIRMFRNEVNLGMCKSVNKLFEQVQGQYVVRLGTDDIYDAHLLEKEVKVLDNHSGYIACCCELMQQSCLGRKIIQRPDVWDLNKILAGEYKGTGYAGGMMFRSSVLDEISIDPNFPVCEDFLFHLELLQRGKIYSIHEPLYCYRKHGANLTYQYKVDKRLEYINKALEVFKKKYHR